MSDDATASNCYHRWLMAAIGETVNVRPFDEIADLSPTHESYAAMKQAGMSTRMINAVMEAGRTLKLNTIRDLRTLSTQDWLDLRNVGQTTLRELIDFLKSDS